MAAGWVAVAGLAAALVEMEMAEDWAEVGAVEAGVRGTVASVEEEHRRRGQRLMERSSPVPR